MDQGQLLSSLISTTSSIEGDCRFEIPPTVAGGLDSIPATHIGTHGEVVSPAFPAADLNEPSDPTLSRSGIFGLGMRPADSCADEGIANATPPTPSLIHLALNNFFFAMFSISLILFIVFFTLAWFTVLWETRLMKDQVLSNTNGVSLHTY